MKKESIKEKVKLIYFPFLIIAVTFIIVYTAFDWYLISTAVSVREDTINFWLPITLPWLLLIIWLRPRINLLNLKRKKGNLPALYFMVSGFAIIAPAIIFQSYLSTATGKLTLLHDVNQIDKVKPTKYYILHDFFVDKNFPGIYYMSRVTGKYNSSLDLYIYIACPIYATTDSGKSTKIGAISAPENSEEIEDTVKSSITVDTIKTFSTNNKSAVHNDQQSVNEKVIANKPLPSMEPPIVDMPAPKAWLCLYYYKQISNRQSDEEKTKSYHKFYYKTLKDFHQKDVASFTYLDRVGNNRNRDGYTKAVQKVNYIKNEVKNPVILEAVYEPFDARNGHKLLWGVLSFCIGSAIFFMMLLFAAFKEGEPQNYLNGSLISH